MDSPTVAEAPSTQTPDDEPIHGRSFIDAMCKAYTEFVDKFAHVFKAGNHSLVEQGRWYLLGLVQAEKRNMERMTEAVPDSDWQVIQNFVTASTWSFQDLMDLIAHQVGILIWWLGTSTGTGVSLNIDGSSFCKKGNKSAGVARQWNGRLGKQDNCQVGVFGALAGGFRVGIIIARLFLPEEWTENPWRCEKAGIPVENRVYLTKVQHAEAIVKHADAIGLKYNFIGIDSEFGRSYALLSRLHNDGRIFVADVPSNRHIYMSDPAPYLPPQGRGRPRVKHESKVKPIEVGKWVKRKENRNRWRKVTVRDSTRGKLVVEILHARVWLWDKSSPTAHQWHLIVRREVSSPDTIKYSVCNAPAKTSINKLAQMQAQRFWIERALQDSKSHLGMAQYQVRQWNSWHRHMALVMLAALFMLQTRNLHSEALPLLSCYDIQVLLAKTLPDRRSSAEELMRQMYRRHEQRRDAIRRSG